MTVCGSRDTFPVRISRNTEVLLVTETIDSLEIPVTRTVLDSGLTVLTSTIDTSFATARIVIPSDHWTKDSWNPRQDLETYETVTPDEVAAVAREHLSPDQCGTITVRPPPT